MNYGQIRKYDVANGPGVRVSFFVTGCYFNCKNCFNPEYQDFNAGKTWTNNESNYIKELLKNDRINGLSIIGGEPFEHAKELVKILDNINTNKNIWIWSGYTFENILKDKNKKELLKRVDVIVDGPFINDKKDLRLKFRGSSNQRIIDVKKSLKENKIILYKFEE